MKSIFRLIIFVILFCSFNKATYTNIKKQEIESSKIYVDSLIGDFNHNIKNDKILILKNNDNLIFQLYEDGSKIPKINSKKIIYKIGDLTALGTEFLSLSFEKNIIMINQEFGSMRPDGWCETYITNKKSNYIVDSISISRKKWGDERVTLDRKSKNLNQSIEKVNLIKEFNMLFKQN